MLPALLPYRGCIPSGQAAILYILICFLLVRENASTRSARSAWNLWMYSRCGYSLPKIKNTSAKSFIVLCLETLNVIVITHPVGKINKKNFSRINKKTHMKQTALWRDVKISSQIVSQILQISFSHYRSHGCNMHGSVSLCDNSPFEALSTKHYIW